MKKRLFALFISLCMLLMYVPALATGKIYLALGDSITTGYAPTNINPDGKVNQPFANNIAEKNGYILYNNAVDGETTTTLLSKLQNGTIDVSNADLITITIGGNDLINAMYEYLSTKYNQNNSDLTLTADKIKEMLYNNSADIKTLMILVNYLKDFINSSEAITALNTVKTNLEKIITIIKDKNTNAEIIIINQYNPYSHISDNGIGIVESFENMVINLNENINDITNTGISVANIYDAFQNANDNPFNAYVTSIFPKIDINFDFHPNQYGHNLIATTVNDMIKSQPLFFLDVPDDKWYTDAIHYTYEKGLMTGTNTNTFSPDAITSRSMISTILWHMAGNPVVNYIISFNDVAQDKWYSEAIRWVSASGIVSGYGNGMFGTNDAITREQLITMLYRFAENQGYNISIGENTNIMLYTDVDQISEYAVPAMKWACGLGIISGTSNNTLSPKDKVTRAQTATIIMRFCENIA